MNRPVAVRTVTAVLWLVASPSWAADPPNTQAGSTTTSTTILERTPLTAHERAGRGTLEGVKEGDDVAVGRGLGVVRALGFGLLGVQGER